MSRKTASKRARKYYKVFRASNFSNLCRHCGKKIKKSSFHHFLCKVCHKKFKMKKNENKTDA